MIKQATSSEQDAKNIFVFDQNKCVGCGACAVACMNENGFQLTQQWRKISNSNPQHFPDIPLFYLSLACNHCDDAPCLKNCPTLAFSRDEQTGAILHHADKCIGCKYCTWACPYDAPKYHPIQGIIEKCTFCNHRISALEKPACAEMCPTGALDFQFANFTRQESDYSSPVPVSVGAHFKTVKLRNSKGPEIDSSLFSDVVAFEPQKQVSKINAKHEWPLLIFTMIAAILVAFKFTGAKITSEIHAAAWLGVGLLAALLSTLHLGKKFRAWRAVFNQKNSWLSREILAFAIFFALLVVDAFFLKIPSMLFGIIGFVLLLSIDKLYVLAMWQWPIKIHSAQTLLIAPSLIFLFLHYPVLFLSISALRISLYVMRGLLRKTQLKFYRIIRVLFLLIVVFGLFYELNMWLLVIIFMIGEFIDRIEFYNELDVPVPSKQIKIK